MASDRKPGIQTSELWIGLIGVALLFVADWQHIELGVATQAAIGGIISAYIVGRSVVKQ